MRRPPHATDRRRRLPLAVAAGLAALALSCADDDADPAEDPAVDADVGVDDDPAADAPSAADEDDGPELETEELEITLRNQEGQEVGTATFVDDSGGVWIEVAVENLAAQPPFRGLHVHEHGECDPDDPDGPFASAGGHYAPADEDHGAHAGDLPPLLVAEDQSAHLTVRTDRFDLAELTADGGTALIIHADPDNLGHIPDRYTAQDADAPGADDETLDTGDAGDRDVCGEITGDDVGELGEEEPEAEEPEDDA